MTLNNINKDSLSLEQRGYPSVMPSQLDDLSNSVVDLLAKKKFKEAEQACNQLLLEFPEQVDGWMRWAQTHAAQGNYFEAADFYRKTADIMRDDGGFDEETIKDMLTEAENLLAKGS